MKSKTGVYYTPQLIADFMVQKSLSFFDNLSSLKILEPSCGDGIFLVSLASSFSQSHSVSVEAVEIDRKAIARAKKRVGDFKVTFYCQDYLGFQKDKINKYDLVIGNPPYIVRKHLASKQVGLCEELYNSIGIDSKQFKNLWSAFLLSADTLLTENGILAFVLPADILQVKFSKVIREYLVENFERIEIVSFQDIVFNGIGQDTVLVFAFKKHLTPGLYFANCDDISNLSKINKQLDRKNDLLCSDFKWIGHVLTQSELRLLKKMKRKFSSIESYCYSAAGIVTAANKYFIISDDVVKKYSLEKYATPIIEKGTFVNGSNSFSAQDFNELKKRGAPCFLLDFNGLKKKDFTSEIRQYLKIGKDINVPERFKCKDRDPWYAVPGIWESEGFFFRRCHLYPKFLKNMAGVLVTDVAYRVKMNEGYSFDSCLYSFYNSLTLCLAELEGRYYGGGVLELTPKEFKHLPLPYVEITPNKFNRFSQRFNTKQSIEDVLLINDREILLEKYKLKPSEIEQLQRIRKKLISKRIRKTNKLV